MSFQRVWLTDEAPTGSSTVFHDDAEIETDDFPVDTAEPTVPGLPPLADPDIRRWRCTSGRSAGVEVVSLDNGRMTTIVCPTRGMGILSLGFVNASAPRGFSSVAWNSPVAGPVHPALVNLESRNGLGWLDGFSELVCRCGLASNGPPGVDPGARSPIESALTLHGRIANIPAHSVCAEIDYAREQVLVRGVVDECTLFGPQLRMTSTISSPFRSMSFTIDDVVENLASTPTELQLLYHINVGTWALEAGSTLLIAADAVAPRDARAAEGIDTWSDYLGPTPGYAEQAYYFKPRADRDNQVTALLRSASGTSGLTVTFDRSQLPLFVCWKCTQPEADGYVTGLEPATNFPNFKGYEREQGRVVSLGPGEKYQTRVTLNVLTTAEEVQAAASKIQSLQGSKPPVLHRLPQPGWSPAGEI